MIVLTHPDEGVACGGQNILVAVTFESVRPTGHLWRAGHNRPKPKQVFLWRLFTDNAYFGFNDHARFG